MLSFQLGGIQRSPTAALCYAGRFSCCRSRDDGLAHPNHRHSFPLAHHRRTQGHDAAAHTTITTITTITVSPRFMDYKPEGTMSPVEGSFYMRKKTWKNLPLKNLFCSTVPCAECSAANILQTSINGHISC